MACRRVSIIATALLLLACGGESSPNTAGAAFELSELRTTAQEAMATAQQSQQRVDELAKEINGARDQALGATREAEKALLEARAALEQAKSNKSSLDSAIVTIDSILARLDALEAKFDSGAALERRGPTSKADAIKLAIYQLASTEDEQVRARELSKLKRLYVEDPAPFREQKMEQHVLAFLARERAEEAEVGIANIKRHLELFASEEGYLAESVTELEAEGYVELDGYEGTHYNDAYIWKGEIENGRFIGTVTANPRSDASPVVRITYGGDGTAYISRGDIDSATLREELRAELE